MPRKTKALVLEEKVPKQRFLYRFVAIVFIATGIFCAPLAAQQLQLIPPPAARVIDLTGTLAEAQKQALEAKLAAFEQLKGSQIAMLLVPTTQPEDIAAYANRVGNSWKIGRKEVGDGVLVVVAKNDRKVRIEVAKTLEGAIPDLAASQIIDEAITPNFRKGDFAAGLDAAADQLIARIKGEALPEPGRPTQGAGKSAAERWFEYGILMLFFLPFLSAFISTIVGRKGGAVLTGAGAGALSMFYGTGLLIAGIAVVAGVVIALITGFLPSRRSGMGSVGSGGWRSGWGGGGLGNVRWGGGGGGGFSSGGGGNFGGGGASGGW